MPLRMPSRTRFCSTDSKCRGGKAWRAASVFAEIGHPGACTATSMTAAIARSPLRGSRGIYGGKRRWRGIVRAEVRYYIWKEFLVDRVIKSQVYPVFDLNPVEPSAPAARSVAFRLFDSTSFSC